MSRAAHGASPDSAGHGLGTPPADPEPAAPGFGAADAGAEAADDPAAFQREMLAGFDHLMATGGLSFVEGEEVVLDGFRAWAGLPPTSPDDLPPDDLAVHDSSGNVFADMGLPDAEARLARAELARTRRAPPPGVARNGAPPEPPGPRPAHQHPEVSRVSPAMQDAIARLQALPPDAQEAIAPRLHDYLTRFEELRALIQEGVDSGPDEPLDMEAIKREARGRTPSPPPDRA